MSEVRMGSRECPHCRKWVPSSEMCRCDGAMAESTKSISDLIETATRPTATAPVEAGPPFEFDRYISGQLMAEGVTIEQATTIEQAALKAAKIASRGPNGECPVLVFRQDSATPP